MTSRSTVAAIALLCLALPLRADDLALERTFTAQVRPFFEKYCTDCHGGEKPEAHFDLTTYSTLAAVVSDQPHWKLITDKLAKNEMPPKDADEHPTVAERQLTIDWIKALRRSEAQKTAGDPGIVLARRLSN